MSTTTYSADQRFDAELEVGFATVWNALTSLGYGYEDIYLATRDTCYLVDFQNLPLDDAIRKFYDLALASGWLDNTHVC
jgi:hypothetical protein